MTAILGLRSITCIETAETFADELYVTFNGTKRSLPNMTQGQTKTLSDEFIFEGSRELSLFENDGDHWYDRDDFIAKHTLTESPADTNARFQSDQRPWCAWALRAECQYHYRPAGTHDGNTPPQINHMHRDSGDLRG